MIRPESWWLGHLEELRQLTVAAFAKKYGVSRGAVDYRRKKHGITPSPRRGAALTAGLQYQILQDLDAGMTQFDAAVKHGVSPSTIHRLAKKHRPPVE